MYTYTSPAAVNHQVAGAGDEALFSSDLVQR